MPIDSASCYRIRDLDGVLGRFTILTVPSGERLTPDPVSGRVRLEPCTTYAVAGTVEVAMSLGLAGCQKWGPLPYDSNPIELFDTVVQVRGVYQPNGDSCSFRNILPMSTDGNATFFAHFRTPTRAGFVDGYSLIVTALNDGGEESIPGRSPAVMRVAPIPPESECPECDSCCPEFPFCDPGQVFDFQRGRCSACQPTEVYDATTGTCFTPYDAPVCPGGVYDTVRGVCVECGPNDYYNPTVGSCLPLSSACAPCPGGGSCPACPTCPPPPPPAEGGSGFPVLALVAAAVVGLGLVAFTRKGSGGR